MRHLIDFNEAARLIEKFIPEVKEAYVSRADEGIWLNFDKRNKDKIQEKAEI